MVRRERRPKKQREIQKDLSQRAWALGGKLPEKVAKKEKVTDDWLIDSNRLSSLTSICFLYPDSLPGTYKGSADIWGQQR